MINRKRLVIISMSFFVTWVYFARISLHQKEKEVDVRFDKESTMINQTKQSARHSIYFLRKRNETFAKTQLKETLTAVKPYTTWENELHRTSTIWADFLQIGIQPFRNRQYFNESSLATKLQHCSSVAPEKLFDDDFVFKWRKRKIRTLCEDETISHHKFGSKVRCFVNMILAMHHII